MTPGLYEGGPAVKMGSYPVGTNPVETKISVFMWTDAIERILTKEQDRIQGAEQTESTIKMIINYGGNTLINQHSDSGRTAELLRDDSKCEFILGMDNFMTPSMEYCDIVLPGVTQFEVNDIITRSMGHGVAYYGQKLVEPMLSVNLLMK